MKDKEVQDVDLKTHGWPEYLLATAYLGLFIYITVQAWNAW